MTTGRLIIITSDASAGGTRGGTSGCAAAIRQRGQDGEQTKAALHYFSWAESSPAEVGAVSLGCDTVVNDKIVGRRVLLITDATAALDFLTQRRRARWRRSVSAEPSSQRYRSWSKRRKK
jgi:hypothetical protein